MKATLLNGEDTLKVIIDGKQVIEANRDCNLGDWHYILKDLLTHFGCSIAEEMEKEPEDHALDSLGDRDWEPEAIANLRAIGKLR